MRAWLGDKTRFGVAATHARGHTNQSVSKPATAATMRKPDRRAPVAGVLAVAAAAVLLSHPLGAAAAHWKTTAAPPNAVCGPGQYRLGSFPGTCLRCSNSDCGTGERQAAAAAAAAATRGIARRRCRYPPIPAAAYPMPTVTVAATPTLAHARSFRTTARPSSHPSILARPSASPPVLPPTLPSSPALPPSRVSFLPPSRPFRP